MSARDLWCEVLRFALDDAIHGVPDAAYISVAQRRADPRAYILEPDADFTLVCHLAGVDPEVVQQSLRRQLAGVSARTPASLRYKV